MKLSATLRSPIQAHQFYQKAEHETKGWLVAGGAPLKVSVNVETRKDGQSRHFHKLIGAVSDHLKGDLADKDDAKRILLSAFRIETLKDFPDEWKAFGELRIGRGLKGETVLLGLQTRDLTVKLGAAFITWLEAFCVEYRVPVSAPREWGGMDS